MKDDDVDDGQHALAERLAGIARELVVAGNVHETLQRIIDLAVEAVGACDHAGISLVVGDHIETPAQSDAVPETIDRIQSETGEGPCRDTIPDHEDFATGDLLQEQRWSAFSREVVERTGVRSMLAIRLFVEGTTLGSLNLYSDHLDAFDDADRNVASMFAAHAAVALRGAQEEQRLNEATGSTDVDVIGEAKGLIMAHRNVDGATALDILRATAEETSRTLREAAEQTVVDHADR